MFSFSLLPRIHFVSFSNLRSYFPFIVGCCLYTIMKMNDFPPIFLLVYISSVFCCISYAAHCFHLCIYRSSAMSYLSLLLLSSFAPPLRRPTRDFALYLQGFSFSPSFETKHFLFRLSVTSVSKFIEKNRTLLSSLT